MIRARVAVTLFGTSLSPLLFLAPACEPHADTVFYPLSVQFEKEEGTSPEGETIAKVTVELSKSSSSSVSVEYSITDESASGHDSCESRDHSGSDGTLTFAPGETQKVIEIRLLDDSVPEADEAFVLQLTSSSGASIAKKSRYRQIIEDDDRDVLLDVVQDFGAIGDGFADDTDALQAAIDRASASDNAVVLFPPGRYLITSIELSPRASYFGYGATLLLAPGQPEDARLLHLEHGGDEDSPLVLFQGFTLDGQRNEQGSFSDWEFQQSALFTAEAKANQAGRLVLKAEDLIFQQTGGSGLVLGPNTDTTICDSSSEDVFTDAIKLRGGGSALQMSDIFATESIGTAGVTLTAMDPGYNASFFIDVSMKRVVLATGDLEIDVRDGSLIVGQNLILEQSPFYLRAPRSSVHLIDSSFVVGPSLFRFNRIVAPGDVHFEGCDFTLTKKVAPGAELEDQNRVFLAAEITWDNVDYAYSEEVEDRLVETLSGGQLLFEDCSFGLADDFDDDDTAYVAGSLGGSGEDHSLLIVAGTVEDGFDGVFAPQCSGCTQSD